ncbi:MAG: AraC family transcriptional regulator [Pseudomonadales bacterium]|nr:AraC family transcriptional regulator [Pseudomonadales bacterium]
MAASLYGDQASDVGACLNLPTIDRPLRLLLAAMKYVCHDHGSDVTRQFLLRAIAARALRAQPLAINLQELPPTAKGVAETKPVIETKLSARQVEAVRDYIVANLADAVGVKDLAGCIGMSRTQFVRRFKASTGMTPHQVVIDARIDKAKELLVNKTLGVDEVAAKCGFAHASHLSAVFRKHLKISPSVYRARAAHGDASAHLSSAAELAGTLVRGHL